MKMGKLTGQVAAGGTLSSAGPNGYFVGKLDVNPFGKSSENRMGNMSGMYLSMATSGKLPPVKMGGRDVKLPEGLAFLWRGPSPIPEICNKDMSIDIALQGPTNMALKAACEMDLVMRLDCKDAPGKCQPVPSLNSIALSDIFVGAKISPSLVEFEVGATFMLATYSSIRKKADSKCDDPYTDSACLTAESKIKVGFEIMPLQAVILSVRQTRIIPRSSRAVRGPRALPHCGPRRATSPPAAQQILPLLRSLACRPSPPPTPTPTPTPTPPTLSNRSNSALRGRGSNRWACPTSPSPRLT